MTQSVGPEQNYELRDQKGLGPSNGGSCHSRHAVYACGSGDGDPHSGSDVHTDRGGAVRLFPSCAGHRLALTKAAVGFLERCAFCRSRGLP